MTKFEELQSRKIKTVGELIKRLQELPPNTRLTVSDADIGGYDVSDADYVDLRYEKDYNIVSFHHLEYEAYEAQEKGLITYDEYEKIVEETNK